MADDLELSAVLDLLTELRELPPGASVPEGLRYRLLGAARGMGAGALGVRGKERERLRSALGDDPSARERLLGFLDDGSPDVRSWAGSYVEQLLPEDEAVESLTAALREEADGEAASWLAMSLARVTPRPPGREVCQAIGDAHRRFGDASDIRRQIARAWGYAGCEAALPVLAEDLGHGGYDQMSVALDGMVALGSVDDPAAVKALWDAFDTAKWRDIKKKAAYLLTREAGARSRDALDRMIDILTDPDHADVQRELAAESLAEAGLPRDLGEERLDALVTGLVVNRDAVAANILKALRETFDDWAERLTRYVVASEDERVISSLSRALASQPAARREAVQILRAYASDGDEDTRRLATAALKEIGGEEAFQTLGELLQSRYIQPSTDLQETSFEVFTDTIARMRSNYEASLRMNTIVFWAGIVVIAAGIVSLALDPANSALFGAAGVVAGLGTLVSLFLFGPLNRVQHALTELVQIEVAFMAFTHRLLQARSIFEQLYLDGAIDLDALARFDELLEKGMTQTVEMLEANVAPPSGEGGTRGSRAG